MQRNAQEIKGFEENYINNECEQRLYKNTLKNELLQTTSKFLEQCKYW